MSERTPRVVLFCGHMIDRPDREPERFPPDMAPLADRPGASGQGCASLVPWGPLRVIILATIPDSPWMT